jgi:hypothetical protein
MFRVIGNNGTVENFKLENVTITSVSGTEQQTVGAVAGKTLEDAAIKQVAVSSGKINSSYLAGGITGENHGTIQDSYNKADVSSVQYAAGISGWNRGNGKIQNVYSVGVITTETKLNPDDYRAGITVSNMESSEIDGAYTTSSYQIKAEKSSNLKVTNSASVLPDKLKEQDTFTNWDFTKVWTIATGQYPTLQSQSYDEDISNLNIPDGSEARPFQITSAVGLKSIGNDAESL